jgi:hypothetical protein
MLKVNLLNGYQGNFCPTQFRRVSGREAVKALGKVGYEVAQGTLRSIIRQAGLSIEEFKALL